MANENIDNYLEKVLPEWKDDKRMEYYMQDFKRHRDVNPQDWDNKMKLWTRVIHEACQINNKLTIDYLTIREYCTRKRRESSKTETPLGLPTIIVC